MCTDFSAKIYEQTKQIVTELFDQVTLTEKHIFVVGVSTSEVMGAKIGSSGTVQAAAAIYRALDEARRKHSFHLAFQCCEHLNRALVLEQNTVQQFGLEEVAVIPVPGAGGAMASYAYKQMQAPKIVEHIRADAGMDIGDTFIGMHVKHVAVPIRASLKQIGEAHVTMAKTRPKLIGGARAVYVLIDDNENKMK